MIFAFKTNFSSRVFFQFSLFVFSISSGGYLENQGIDVQEKCILFRLFISGFHFILIIIFLKNILGRKIILPFEGVSWLLRVLGFH